MRRASFEGEGRAPFMTFRSSARLLAASLLRRNMKRPFRCAALDRHVLPC